MSFSRSVEMVRALSQRFNEVRKQAVQSLPQARSAPFNTILEIIEGAVKASEMASEIEERAGLKGKGVKRVCGSWLLVNEGDRVGLVKMKPLRVIAHDIGRGVLTLANETVRLEISGNGIAISFRGYRVDLGRLDLEYVASKADEIKTLGRYVKGLVDYIVATMEVCVKSLRAS